MGGVETRVSGRFAAWRRGFARIRKTGAKPGKLRRVSPETGLAPCPAILLTGRIRERTHFKWLPRVRVVFTRVCARTYDIDKNLIAGSSLGCILPRGTGDITDAEHNWGAQVDGAALMIRQHGRRGAAAVKFTEQLCENVSSLFVPRVVPTRG